MKVSEMVEQDEYLKPLFRFAAFCIWFTVVFIGALLIGLIVLGVSSLWGLL